MKHLLRKGRQSRKLRVRAKVHGTKSIPRLSVYRSSRYIYAQLIDDDKSHTEVSVHEKELSIPSGKKLNKSERAKLLGQLLAEKAQKQKFSKIVFDRNGYKYHGRVKALADGARSSGLKF